MGSDLRSLIIAPQWIGDAVMTEPLLRRLAARGEHLTVGALPWVAPIYRAMPHVAEVLEFPFAHGGLQWKARRSLARQIEGRFDVAYICPNSLKSALLPFLASIPKRVGYLGETRVGLLTHRLKNPPKTQRPAMVAFYSALSGDTDISTDRPQLQVQEIDDAVQKIGLQRGGYDVLVPGAEYGPAKRWPTAHFAQLAQDLERTVVLLGSGKEFALCEEIAAPVNANSAGKCLNLAGTTTLTQALSVITAARCVISNDSGMMHVAAALGVPQVALFGSSSPLHTPPLSAKAAVLWLKTNPAFQGTFDCAPCFERVCPLGHTRCLTAITPAMVLHQLAHLLPA